eukprot:4179455-Heterocapsa_arctica.AAC.1
MVTYMDIARCYERFLCPEAGQGGSHEEPSREHVLRTGRTVIDLDPEVQDAINQSQGGEEQVGRKRPRGASEEDVPNQHDPMDTQEDFQGHVSEETAPDNASRAPGRNIIISHVITENFD